MPVLPPALRLCSGGMNVEDLTAAIRAAERYPSLQPEVAQARALKERWIRRAEAQVGAPLDPSWAPSDSQRLPTPARFGPRRAHQLLAERGARVLSPTRTLRCAQGRHA